MKSHDNEHLVLGGPKSVAGLGSEPSRMSRTERNSAMPGMSPVIVGCTVTPGLSPSVAFDVNRMERHTHRPDGVRAR